MYYCLMIMILTLFLYRNIPSQQTWRSKMNMDNPGKESPAVAKQPGEVIDSTKVIDSLLINSIMDVIEHNYTKSNTEIYQILSDSLQKVKIENKNLRLEKQKLLDIINNQKSIIQQLKNHLTKEARLSDATIKRLVEKNRFDTLEILFEKEIQKSAVNFFERGMLAEIQFKYAKAESNYEQAVTCDSTNLKYLKKYGNILFKRGKYRQAVEIYLRLLLILKELPGKVSERVWVLNDLGLVYQELGETRKAVDYFKKALTLWIDNYGTRHQFTATLYNNLGSVHTMRGEYIAAIELFNNAIEIQQKNGAYNDPQTAVSYDNLGFARQHMGIYEEAVKYYRRALNIRKMNYKGNHPEFALSYNKLGNAWYALKKYDKATDYFKKALAINKTIYNSIHPVLATCYNNIGSVLLDDGRFDSAQAYYSKALTISLNSYGKINPNTATAYNNLGSVMTSRKEYDSALAYFESAMHILKKLDYADKNEDLAKTYSNLGVTFLYLKKNKKAIEYLETNLHVLLKLYPSENHPSVAQAYQYLGKAWLYLRKRRKAVFYLNRASEIWQKIYNQKQQIMDTLEEKLPETKQ